MLGWFGVWSLPGLSGHLSTDNERGGGVRRGGWPPSLGSVSPPGSWAFTFRRPLSKSFEKASRARSRQNSVPCNENDALGSLSCGEARLAEKLDFAWYLFCVNSLSNLKGKRTFLDGIKGRPLWKPFGCPRGPAEDSQKYLFCRALTVPDLPNLRKVLKLPKRLPEST